MPPHPQFPWDWSGETGRRAEVADGEFPEQSCQEVRTRQHLALGGDLSKGVVALAGASTAAAVRSPRSTTSVVAGKAAAEARTKWACRRTAWSRQRQPRQELM
ncbi:MAG: hypothetical protein ABSF27_06600 [Candidatus Dormibacteria bacterium]